MPAPTHILTKNFLPLTRSYFDREVLPCLQATQESIQPTIKRYSIAGKNICIYFYGEKIAHVFSLALAHQQEATSPHNDLTIHTWDSMPTKKVITAPWDDIEFKKDQAHTDPAFFGVYVGGEESLNFYSPETKTGYFWTHDASRVPDWSLGAPFRTILHWFFTEQNVHLIHGAVVGHDDTSVLLTARSGSGKSTTSLACLLSGMEYLADDYVAITTSTTNKSPIAHSLYQTAKMTREGTKIFPELENIIWHKKYGEGEKAVVFLSEHFPNQVKNFSPLSAIFIPRIIGGETTIIPASKIEAMLAIAPTTLLQLPLAETNKVGAFRDILEEIPCYFINLGSDIRAIPEVIKNFITETNLEK